MLNNRNDNRRDGKRRRQHLVKYWKKLPIEDLYAVRDDVAAEISTRKRSYPWFGIYIHSEHKWLDESLNVTVDASNAKRWINSHVAYSWMEGSWIRGRGLVCLWLYDQGYSGLAVRRLPLLRSIE